MKDINRLNEQKQIKKQLDDFIKTAEEHTYKTVKNYNKPFKLYVTFGSVHNHIIDGVYFNHNCVAEIECKDYYDGRRIAFEVFGPKFCTTYTEEEIQDSLHYYPKGIIKVPLSKNKEEK